MTTSILLAEDHAIVRLGLRVLLAGQPDFCLAGEAADGPTALRLLTELKPDVLVLDLMLPGLHGLEVARQAARCSPATRLVVLSMHADPVYVAAALRAGVWGYVLKQFSAESLVTAIRQALAGRRYLSPPLRLLDLQAAEAQAAGPDTGPLPLLTPRQREVLRLVAEGLTSAQISGRLGLSPRTVDMHRHHAMQKLGLHTRAELVRFVMEHGLSVQDDLQPR
ncbi:MAG: response regulator transcription factor [Anaerolineales bacterium]|nr:response regulator transcription factor [Anaerolineales bacterium]